MTKPVALEPPTRIELLLAFQKLVDLGIRSLDLIGCRVAVVGQKERAAAIERAVDEMPERLGGAFDTGFSLGREEIEDNARKVPLGPGQECLGIPLDEAGGAVGESRVARADDLGGVVQELDEPITRHVQLGDDLRTLGLLGEVCQPIVVAWHVRAELVCVGLIDLAGC